MRHTNFHEVNRPLSGSHLDIGNRQSDHVWKDYFRHFSVSRQDAGRDGANIGFQDHGIGRRQFHSGSQAHRAEGRVTAHGDATPVSVEVAELDGAGSGAGFDDGQPIGAYSGTSGTDLPDALRRPVAHGTRSAVDHDEVVA